MRYAFNNESVALINRVEASAFQRTLAEYGVTSVLLLSILWTEADCRSDYGGETDYVHDLYPALKERWQGYMEVGYGPDYEKAEGIAVEFENRLQLAVMVVNALEALQCGAGNIWAIEGMMERVDEEFKQERENVANAINEALRGG